MLSSNVLLLPSHRVCLRVCSPAIVANLKMGRTVKLLLGLLKLCWTFQDGQPLNMPDRSSPDEVKSLQATDPEHLRQQLAESGKQSRNRAKQHGFAIVDIVKGVLLMISTPPVVATSELVNVADGVEACHRCPSLIDGQQPITLPDTGPLGLFGSVLSFMIDCGRTVVLAWCCQAHAKS